MAEVVADVFELEAMVKEDSSWHPCKVSLSSTASSLILDFGSQYPEDVLFTEEEALACLRFRSNPLQGDDCLHLKEGDHVLASPKTPSKSLFFDAEVEKVHRVRHSKKIYCRCTFEIKWLCPVFRGGNVTVPSSSIMKMARNKIDSHPTVAAFLNSVKSLNFSGGSPFASLPDDIGETDLPIVLDRQIEEIIKLADAPMKGCVEENFFELNRVNFVGQEGQRRTITSQASSLHDMAPHEKNNSRRSTRSQVSVKHPPQPVPDESDRPHLSPLGARAALASLVHGLPRKQEFSILHVEQALPSVSPNKHEKHATSAFLGMRTFLDFDGCIQEKLSVQNDILCLEETDPSPVTLEQTETTKSLTSERRGASKKSAQIKESLEVLKQEKPAQMLDDPEDEISKTASVKTRLTTSATDKKLNHSVKATRLTRSAVQKGTSISNNDVELESLTEDTKLSSPSHTTRLTRSALQKEGGNLMAKLKEGLPCSTVQKGTRNSNNDVELKFSTEDTNFSPPTHTKRLTRSALQKEGVNLILKSKEGLEESKPAEATWSDSNERDRISPVAKDTRTKKSLASPIENLSRAQEKNKKQKVSDVAPLTRRRGENSGNGEDSQAEEKTSSKKKLELRSSPRLRLLPPTRSQKKSSTS